MIRQWRMRMRAKAAAIREELAREVEQWERDTEPGHPLPPLAEQRRQLGQNLADIYDRLGGGES